MLCNISIYVYIIHILYIYYTYYTYILHILYMLPPPPPPPPNLGAHEFSCCIIMPFQILGELQLRMEGQTDQTVFWILSLFDLHLGTAVQICRICRQSAKSSQVTNATYRCMSAKLFVASCQYWCSSALVFSVFQYTHIHI